MASPQVRQLLRNIVGHDCVDGIVNRDDAEQLAGVVDDGHR